MSTPEFVKGASGPLQQWESGGQTITPTYLGGATVSQSTTVTPTPGGGTSYRKTTAKVVNTTVSATDLLNGEITIAANALGTDSMGRLYVSGDWKQNSGGDADLPRFQLVLGGTTVIDTGSTGNVIAANATTRYGFEIQITIAELGATNAQWVSFEARLAYKATGNAPATNQVFTTGEGSYNSTSNTSSLVGFGLAVGGNSATKDTTASLAVVLNVINASSNANYETALKNALLVLE